MAAIADGKAASRQADNLLDAAALRQIRGGLIAGCHEASRGARAAHNSLSVITTVRIGTDRRTPTWVT